MNEKQKKIILFYIFIVAGFFLLTGHGAPQKWCCLCGMDLQKYNRTRYILTLDNGTQKHTCSIHCAAIILKKHDVKEIKAADYLTGDMIDAKNAYYIVGSNVKGVMSKRSKLAFADENRAADFKKKHGGKLTDFNGGLSAARDEMSEDMAILKNKLEYLVKMGKIVAEANNCFTCHGENGSNGINNPGSKNGIIPPWTIQSKGEIKKIIILGKKSSGAIQMPGAKDYIKGKELHALANYVWKISQGQTKKLP